MADTYTAKRQALTSVVDTPAVVQKNTTTTTTTTTVSTISAPVLPVARAHARRNAHWIDVSQVPVSAPAELYAPVHGYYALY